MEEDEQKKNLELINRLIGKLDERQTKILIEYLHKENNIEEST